MEIMQYEKVGKCRKLEGDDYCFYAEYNDMGDLIFKDEEAFVKAWNEPCYIPTSGFGDSSSKYYITPQYETHISLLEQCNYNEKLCECMFEHLDWQSPTTWLNELDAEDYAAFYDFVQVGNTVFWHEQPWKRIPMGYYEVVEIKDNPEDWSLLTSVILKVKDCNGEWWNVESHLRELSQTDIKLKINKLNHEKNN